MPKVMVGQYERQLRQLTTTLSDYLSKRKYPNSWPISLSAYEIVIEALVVLLFKHHYPQVARRSNDVNMFDDFFLQRSGSFNAVANGTIYRTIIVSKLSLGEFH